MVVRAIPITGTPGADLPASALSSASTTEAEPFFSHWRRLRNNFELSADQSLSCGLCRDPALPFTVLTPCGHVACQECAEDSSLCPRCDHPILARTVVPQMQQVVVKTTTFRCLANNDCYFSCVGDIEAVSAHRCGIDARGDPLLEQVLDSLARERLELLNPRLVLRVLNNYRHELVPLAPFVLRKILDHLTIENATAKATKTRRTQRFVGPVEVPPIGPTEGSSRRSREASLSTEEPTTRRAHIFWDYTTICPRIFGVSPSDFLDDLIDVFQRTFKVCCGEVRCIVYVMPGEPDENELRDLGTSVRCLQGSLAAQEEQVFRTCEALDDDLQLLIESNLQGKVTMIDAVLVSNESNFNAAKGILRECGIHVHAVHDCVNGLEEAHFSRGCSTTTDVKLMPCVKSTNKGSQSRSRSFPAHDDSSAILNQVRYIPPISLMHDDPSDDEERYL